MKKLLSLFMAVAIVLSSLGGAYVLADETEQTYGYDNLNDAAGDLKVAFLGGSITQGAGDTTNRTQERYSSLLVNNYFKTKFPNKTVTEINAGIGGTPSEYGVFRTAKDVSAFAPDVVFVEFAVNDSGKAQTTAGQTEVKASMEGIVRQLTSLPKVPTIIFLYTHTYTNPSWLERSIKAQQQIADYYGIGSVNLHEYIKSEEESGNITWYDPDKATEGVLSGDGTHPNTAGYALYESYLEKCFNKSYSSYFKKPKIRKTPLVSAEQTFGNPHTVAYTDSSIQYTGDWTPSTELDVYDWVKNPENLNGTFYQAQKGGETVTYTATCRSLGLAFGNIFNGNKTIKWVLDEGTDNEKSGTISEYTDGIRYFQRYVMFGRDMELKEHTVKITNEVNTAEGEENNTNFAFSHFLVDDANPVIEPDDTPAYDDYIPADTKPANMIPVGTYKSNMRFVDAAGRNSGDVRTDGGSGDWVNDLGGYSQKTVWTEAQTSESNEGFNGFIIKNKSSDNTEILYPNFKFDGGKSYVVSARFKQTEGDPASFGISITKGRAKTTTFTKEYGKDGMALTSEYQNFAGTIRLDSSYDEDDSTLHQVTFGFPAGTPAGANVSVDTSYADAVYIAEETPYDITNTIVSGSESVMVGSDVKLKAAVVNQIGIPGNLAQNFTWYVMNEDKTEEAQGFTINTNGAEATVSVAEDAATGVYSVVAVSNDYNKMIKTQKITVVNKPNYQDWEKGEKPENLIPELSGSRARRIATPSRNSGDVQVAVAAEWSEGSPSYLTIEASNDITAERAASSFHGRSAVLEGVQLNKAKNYVFSMKAKSLSDVAANVGVSLNNDSNANSVSVTNEYQKSGMALEQGEYQTFAATIQLVSGFDTAKSNVLTIGLPKDTKQGAKIQIDTSTNDAVYLAEEAPYDITLTKTAGEEKLFGDGSMTFKAEVQNQIGTTGNLEQHFTWYAMKPGREKMADGIIITPSSDTRTATVKMSSTATSGKYDIVAISDDYSMAKGATIKVVGNDYYQDYKPGTKNENLYRSVTGAQNAHEIFSRSFARTTGAVTTQDATDSNGNVIGMDINVGSAIESSTLNPIPGFVTTKVYNGNTALWQENFDGFKKGTSYVFKIRAKDTAQLAGEPAKINIAMHNESNNKASISYADQYNGQNEGMTLTGEYQDFIATITPAAGYNESSANQFLSFGFANGTVAGTQIRVDAADDSIYLAPEQVYDIENTITGDTNLVNSGSSLSLSAKVVNQLDVVGSLDQSFEWAAMDTGRSTFIDGITVTPSADTKTATVTVSDQVAEGEYDIVAVSKAYDIVKGVRIKVVPRSELISSFEMIEDAGYLELKAEVTDSEVDQVMFVIAQYAADNSCKGVRCETVNTVNGSASTDIYFDDALENGTKVRAFIWDAKTLRPIANTKGFVMETTITTAQ